MGDVLYSIGSHPSNRVRLGTYHSGKYSILLLMKLFKCSYCSGNVQASHSWHSIFW